MCTSFQAKGTLTGKIECRFQMLLKWRQSVYNPKCSCCLVTHAVGVDISLTTTNCFLYFFVQQHGKVCELETDLVLKQYTMTPFLTVEVPEAQRAAIND